ncbi:MAG: trigger factor [Actinobacteria bacterium]|nr:trigger factor [Actinomycetota bacterium]
MTPRPADAPALDVEVERLPDSPAKLTVVAPVERVEKGISRAVGRLAGQVRLPGFRPGHAPAAVLERAVGWEAIQQEAVDLLLPELYAEAIRQADLEPVSQPQVAEAQLERGEPFRFVVTVGVRPPVTLGDYHQLRVPVEVKPVADEDIDTTIAELRQRYAQLVDVDRAVEAGDVVTAELTMLHNGEPVGAPDQVQTLDLERGGLIPGMAEQLVGAVAGGDPVEITLTMPEDYSREELRGELVTITAKVTRVQAKELPALDDNLAAIVGRGETLAELREYIREQIAAGNVREAEQAQVAAALEELLGITKVDVPESMIQAEIDHQLRDFSRRLEEGGLTLEALLAAQGSSLEQLRGERRQPAVQAVRLDLALSEVVRREQISVSDEEVGAARAGLIPKGSSKADRQRLREAFRRELEIGKARELVAALARGDSTDQASTGS